MKFFGVFVCFESRGLARFCYDKKKHFGVNYIFNLQTALKSYNFSSYSAVSEWFWIVFPLHHLPHRPHKAPTVYTCISNSWGSFSTETQISVIQHKPDLTLKQGSRFLSHISMESMFTGKLQSYKANVMSLSWKDPVPQAPWGPLNDSLGKSTQVFPKDQVFPT